MMKVGNIKPIVETTRLSRRKANQPIPKYQSDIDPAVIIHSNKTHSSVSEAFRDADYATAIWKCKTDWDRTMEYLYPLLSFILGGLFIYEVCLGVTKWLS
jgi:hypothetical protein